MQELADCFLNINTNFVHMLKKTNSVGDALWTLYVHVAVSSVDDVG